MSDEAKKAILARRARFVAAALAGVAGSACGKSKLEAPPAPDAEVRAADPATPMPCLTAIPVPPEAVPDAAPPMPCLRIAAPRRDAGPCDPHDPLCAPDPKKTK